MKVLFINNDGGGFADHIDLADHTTVESLFEQRLPDRQPSDYLIRVNRQTVPRGYVLQDGDRVSMTPTKIAGANPAPGSAPGTSPGRAPESVSVNRLAARR